MTMTCMHTFTRESFKRLKEQYQKAAKKGRDTFSFEGTELVTDYAKYLIEYLEGRAKQ